MTMALHDVINKSISEPAVHFPQDVFCAREELLPPAALIAVCFFARITVNGHGTAQDERRSFLCYEILSCTTSQKYSGYVKYCTEMN